MIAWLAIAAHAGAWTKDLGAVYAKAGADLYSSLRYVSPFAGEEDPDAASFFGQRYGVYAELGVLPKWRGQLTVSAPVVVGVHRAELTDALGVVPIRATTARFGDLALAAQVALHPTAPIAAAVELKVPMYTNGGIGADFPLYVDQFPKPGDGQVDVTTWLFAGLAGASAGGGSGFAEAGVGWVHRTEWFVGWPDPVVDDNGRITPIAFGDGLALRVKGGWRLGRVTPIIGLDARIGAAADDPFTRQSVTADGAAVIDLGGGFAVEPRVAGELWARNTSQGLGAGLGLSYRGP